MLGERGREGRDRKGERERERTKGGERERESERGEERERAKGGKERDKERESERERAKMGKRERKRESFHLLKNFRTPLSTKLTVLSAFSFFRY